MIPKSRGQNLLWIISLAIGEYCQHFEECHGCIFQKEDKNCFGEDIKRKLEGE